MLLKVDQYQLNNEAYNQVNEYYIHHFSTMRGKFYILFSKSNKYYALVFDDWDKAPSEGMAVVISYQMCLITFTLKYIQLGVYLIGYYLYFDYTYDTRNDCFCFFLYKFYQFYLDTSRTILIVTALIAS